MSDKPKQCKAMNILIKSLLLGPGVLLHNILCLLFCLHNLSYNLFLPAFHFASLLLILSLLEGT